MKPISRRRFAICALLLALAGIGATRIPIAWNYLTPITVTAQEEATPMPGLVAPSTAIVPLTDAQGNTLPRNDKGLHFDSIQSSGYIQKVYPTAIAGRTVRLNVRLREPLRSDNGQTMRAYVYLRYAVDGGGSVDRYLSQKQTTPLVITSANSPSGSNQATTFTVSLQPAAPTGKLNIQIFLRDRNNISDADLGDPDKTFSLDLLGS